MRHFKCLVNSHQLSLKNTTVVREFKTSFARSLALPATLWHFLQHDPLFCSHRYIFGLDPPRADQDLPESKPEHGQTFFSELDGASRRSTDSPLHSTVQQLKQRSSTPNLIKLEPLPSPKVQREYTRQNCCRYKRGGPVSLWGHYGELPSYPVQYHLVELLLGLLSPHIWTIQDALPHFGKWF